MTATATDIRRPSNTQEVLPLPPQLRYFEAEPRRGKNKPVMAKRDEDDRLHSDDGHAVEFDDHAWEFWKHGRVHRDVDEPAMFIDHSNSVELLVGSPLRDVEEDLVSLTPGSQVYCMDGLIHREGGPAIANHGDEDSYCIEFWHRGRRHCAEDAAVATSYVQLWYYHGLLHRENGPACIRSDFAQSTCYWYGRALTFDEGLPDDFPLDEPPALLILHALASSDWCPDVNDHRVFQLVSRACTLMPTLNLLKADLDDSAWSVFRDAIRAFLDDPETSCRPLVDTLPLPEGFGEEA